MVQNDLGITKETNAWSSAGHDYGTLLQRCPLRQERYSFSDSMYHVPILEISEVVYSCMPSDAVPSVRILHHIAIVDGSDVQIMRICDFVTSYYDGTDGTRSVQTC